MASESDYDSDYDYNSDYDDSIYSNYNTDDDDDSGNHDTNYILNSDFNTESTLEPLVEPLIEPSVSKAPKHSIGARIQALSFLELNMPQFEITARTGISKSWIYKLRKKALANGWNPEISGIVEVSHIEDSLRSGRPKTPQNIVNLILETVTTNSTTRGYSSARIAHEVSSKLDILNAISPKTVYNVLKENGYSSCKRTIKPGLKDDDKERRLKWCLDHEDWTLEDWKNVIWTDETSVQLGGIRGRRRIWRKKDEAFHPHIITRRWKGFSEFIWWSCFSYNKKGPFHI
jgi:transposase